MRTATLAVYKDKGGKAQSIELYESNRGRTRRKRFTTEERHGDPVLKWFANAKEARLEFKKFVLDRLPKAEPKAPAKPGSFQKAYAAVKDDAQEDTEATKAPEIKPGKVKPKSKSK